MNHPLKLVKDGRIIWNNPARWYIGSSQLRRAFRSRFSYSDVSLYAFFTNRNYGNSMAGPSVKTNRTINGSAGIGKGQRPSSPVEALLRQYVTTEEEEQIIRQFQLACIPGRQVLWTGMFRNQAQKWADDHGMQTLTTAMGSLMDPKDPECPQHFKTGKAWSKYIHGASAVFAWFISGGDLVTVLSQPPPVRFNPSQGSSYQTIEEPIIMGKTGISNQMWPVDQADLWKEKYGKLKVPLYEWRKTKEIKVESLILWWCLEYPANDRRSRAARKC